MVTIGQLENFKIMFELKAEVRDIDFHEIFIVTGKPTSPVIGLSYLQRNDTILNIRLFLFFYATETSGSLIQ